MKAYTKEELDKKASYYQRKIELLKRERLLLSKQIRAYSKELEYWQSMDVNQIYFGE